MVKPVIVKYSLGPYKPPPSWKGRLLNKPGRVVLANAVLNALPSYGMQIQWYPQCICDYLDRSASHFIWKGSDDKGLHLASWKKMTRTKKLGGLGTRVARHQNTALLGKVIWELLNSENKLWVQLFKDLYIKGGSLFDVIKKRGSPTWNSIGRALRTLQEGFELKMGDGNTRFWYAPWVMKSPLCCQVTYVDIHDTDLKVKHVWNGASWNLDMLYTPLSTDVCDRINNIKPWLDMDVPDVWVWKNAINGTYSVRYAYGWLMERSEMHGNGASWGWIWKLKVPANMQFFLWQVCHEAIPTRSDLKTRGIAVNELCPVCNNHTESISHCLFGCTRARGVWSRCFPQLVIPLSDSVNYLTWLRDVISDHGIGVVVVMWLIWCSRNKCIFEDKNHSIVDIYYQVLGMVNHISSAYNGVEEGVQKPERLVSWKAPACGTIAVNVDGSVYTDSGEAGFGGLLRDHAGNFLYGFYGSIGQSCIIHAEILAIYHGLQLCWDKGYRKVACYSDSSHVVDLVNNEVLVHHRYSAIVAAIRRMMRQQWMCVVLHTLREGNSSADFLAKLGARSTSSLIVIQEAPYGMVSNLLADAMQVSFVRC